MLNSINISVAGWGRGIISHSYLVRFLSKGGRKSLWLSKPQTYGMPIVSNESQTKYD